MNDWDEKRHADVRASEIENIFTHTTIRLKEKDLIYLGAEYYVDDAHTCEPENLRETRESEDNSYSCANFICIVEWDEEQDFDHWHVKQVGPWLTLRDLQAETKVSRFSSMIEDDSLGDVSDEQWS